MRRTFAIIILFICCIGESHAQLILGPILGVNFSGTAGGESFTNYNRDYGWKAGAEAYIPLGKKYSLNPELVITTKSYKYNYIDSYPVNNMEVPSYYYERLIFGYVEVPVTVQRKFSSGVHMGAGAFTGYQISQRQIETIDYEVEVNSVVTDFTATSSVREITADRFQTGALAELGYMKSGFDLSLASEYHLTPLYGFAVDTPGKLHFFNLTLSLAYHFRWQGKQNAS